MGEQILAADNVADLRMKMAKEAIAAQLNINNMAGDSTATNNLEGPNNLTGEAAMWLRGVGPYTYSGSTGRIDTNGDGIISESGSNNAEFNKNSGVFTSDANGGVSGLNLTPSLAAWIQKVDIDGAAGSLTASGADLLHALQSFNGGAEVGDEGHLVVAPQGSKVAWYDGTVDIVGVPVSNTADSFWSVLEAHNVI